MLIATNPINGARLHEFSPLDEQATGATIASVNAAFQPWSKTSFTDRADVLRKVAANLRDKKNRAGRIDGTGDGQAGKGRRP